MKNKITSQKKSARFLLEHQVGKSSFVNTLNLV
ncbi:hypothetical protein C8N26_0268 [Tenacibaculum lutimaris]|uniref:Uncharacterized protein n=1 Tax=Tenacibaculum lutimaris TaxID=285258 RepID=A0A420E3Y3_9FLAO|nr:hypothetical protein C8N26_0268 [Tenacibaculum lutimaris]